MPRLSIYHIAPVFLAAEQPHFDCERKIILNFLIAALCSKNQKVVAGKVDDILSYFH